MVQYCEDSTTELVHTLFLTVMIKNEMSPLEVIHFNNRFDIIMLIINLAERREVSLHFLSNFKRDR